MDYKRLLEKYIQHVYDCEGVNFISNIGDAFSTQDFTKEEKEYLEGLSDDQTVQKEREGKGVDTIVSKTKEAYCRD